MSTDPVQPTTIDYRRPPRASRANFAGLFLTLGALNILMAGALLLVQLLALIAIFATWVSGSVRTGRLPFDVLTLFPFGVICAGLVIVGSIGSFIRAGWSRKLIRAGLAGDLAVSAISLILAFYTIDLRYTATLLPIGLYGIRCLWGGVFFYFYSNLRGDFYFQEYPGRPAMNNTAPPAEVSAPTPKVTVSAARFFIDGFDVTTQQFVRIPSKAASEELARKSAVALGLDPETVTVSPASTT